MPIITNTKPTQAPAAPKPAVPAAPAAPAAPAVAKDALALSKPEAPKAPAQEPMNKYEAGVKKALVIGTIAGGIAITTAVGLGMAGSMGAAGVMALGAALLADGLMGLLGWHIFKSRFAQDGGILK